MVNLIGVKPTLIEIDFILLKLAVALNSILFGQIYSIIGQIDSISTTSLPSTRGSWTGRVQAVTGWFTMGLAKGFPYSDSIML